MNQIGHLEYDRILSNRPDPVLRPSGDSKIRPVIGQIYRVLRVVRGPCYSTVNRRFLDLDSRVLEIAEPGINLGMKYSAEYFSKVQNYSAIFWPGF